MLEYMPVQPITQKEWTHAVSISQFIVSLLFFKLANPVTHLLPHTNIFMCFQYRYYVSINDLKLLSFASYFDLNMNEST